MQTLTEYYKMKEQELFEAREVVTNTRIRLRHALTQEKINQEQLKNAAKIIKDYFLQNNLMRSVIIETVLWNK